MSARDRLLQKMDIKKLACLQLKKENPDQQFFEVDYSPGEHFSYDVLERKELEGDDDAEERCEQLLEWQYPEMPETAVLIRQRTPGFLCLEDFREVEEIGTEIDYTGSVCVWPAEEILSYYMTAQREIFRGKTVCELGAGSALAGLMLATTGIPASICLTDGNPTVVKAIKQNISLNEGKMQCPVTAEQLLFTNELTPECEHLREAFDFIIAGDCTVNVEIHDILIGTIRQLLKPDGVFMYLAPRRGKSLGKFVKMARLEPTFEVETNTDYDEQIAGTHHRLQTIHGEGYDTKKNYPILVTIRRVEAGTAVHTSNGKPMEEKGNETVAETDAS